MACIDDDWENFLTQGTIILSDEKKTSKKNINKVYSENDKISQSMNSMNGMLNKQKSKLPNIEEMDETEETEEVESNNAKIQANKELDEIQSVYNATKSN